MELETPATPPSTNARRLLLALVAVLLLVGAGVWLLTQPAAIPPEPTLPAELSSEVTRILETAEKAGASKAEAWFNVAYLLEQQGKLDLAQAVYEYVTKLDPKLEPTYVQLGQILEDYRKYQEAALMYQRGLLAVPGSAELALRLGRVNELLGDVSAAEGWYRKATELDANNADAHNNLGVMLGQMQRYDEAVRCFQQSLVLEPGNIKTRNNLGVILTYMGHYDQAITELEKVTKEDENYAEAWSNLALAHLQRGDHEQAVGLYRKSLGINPGLVLSRFNLGYVLINQLGRKAEGIAEWETLLKQAPDHPQAAVVREELDRLR